MAKDQTKRQRVARVSRATNRFVAPVLTRLPGFGVLEHTGRVSGRRYETPLRLLGDPELGEAHISLTYGPTTDWYQNLTAAPSRFRCGERTYVLSNPRLVAAPEVELGRPLRRALDLLGITQLVRVNVTTRQQS